MSCGLAARAWRARGFLLIALAGVSPGYALDSTAPPSSNFDLTRWKLTLPSAEEVDPWVLSNGYVRKPAFFTDPRSGGMVFRSPNLAQTTANSRYSRCELREMLDPGSSAHDDSNNWTTVIGGRMKARLRVDRVSTTGDSDKAGRVIIGQIHGPETEPVRLYFDKAPGQAKGRIYVASETVSGKNRYSTDIVGNGNGDGIALGELFTYVIALKGTYLRIDILRDRGKVVNTYIADIDPGYQGLNLYFKAGVYNQNNTGSTSDFAQATFYTLTHSH